jgi:hypothetical protein
MAMTSSAQRSGLVQGRWRTRGRVAVMAAASFVLLLVVLPPVASAIGLGSIVNRLESATTCSSGSGSGSTSTPTTVQSATTPTTQPASSGSSSQCPSGSSGSSGPPAPGVVTGTVTITGAPAGFAPTFVGAGACPDVSGPGSFCSDPQYSLLDDGTYSLDLSPGTWLVDGFFSNQGFGADYLGTAQVVQVASGGTVVENLAVPYSPPATVAGKVTVTGVPTGVTVQDLEVILCPSFSPITGSQSGTPITCDTGSGVSYGVPTSTYSLSDLPPGSYLAYGGYCTQYGCEIDSQQPTAFKLQAGATKRLNVTTPFIIPGNGLVAATVDVPGTPATADVETQVTACQLSTGSCQTEDGLAPGASIDLLLADGRWTLTGSYLLAPFFNDIGSVSATVDVAGGVVTPVTLTVPYEATGTAAGTIVTPGIAWSTVQSYSVTACPASSPIVDGIQAAQCADEYSGPGGSLDVLSGAAALKKLAAPAGRAEHVKFNTYSIDTLPAGKWLLYPGYTTAYGTFTAAAPTAVTVAAGATTTKRLVLPGQPATVGAVSGTVDVTGQAQNGGDESGVLACNQPPSTSATDPCPAADEAIAQTDGSYTLQLPPGTWWLEGFVYVFSSPEGSEVVGPARAVTVLAGHTNHVDLVVNAG